MSMEYVFFVGVLAVWLAAAGAGAVVALRNLKLEWGDSFTFRRPTKDSLVPATTPETPQAKRKFTR